MVWGVSPGCLPTAVKFPLDMCRFNNGGNGVIIWSTPTADWIEVNMDANTLNIRGKTGSGMVARLSNGTSVAARSATVYGCYNGFGRSLRCNKGFKLD
ncbi:conserved hypothetical protein [Ricinus communis]|uniref:Uncharacterized protein n=1 Tax=Ricinus communis TaxID=3988 RepID=B9S739_RICCO|nr:conserved hypothetical protein [Ricinus communis]